MHRQYRGRRDAVALTVIATILGLIPTRGINYFDFFTLATKQIASLSSASQNWAVRVERSVLTLRFSCLPYQMRDSA